MENNKKTKILIFLVVILAGLFVYFNFLNKPTLITIVGVGRATAKPQQVKFSVAVINSSVSSTQAITENIRIVNDLISVLKQNGVAENDITSSYVRLVPSGTTQLTYQAVNSIDAVLKDLSKFDGLVIQLYGSGAISVSNIVFTTADSQTMEKEAVALAIKEAKLRGKELAKATGKSLGRMVSVATGEVGEAGAVSGSGSTQDVSGAFQASPSQIQITRQASIVFELR